MKKRRVLALFLALSMTLSSNAFTVLAAEKDPGFTVEANSLEETDESGISEESGEAGNEGGVSEENADAESGNDVLDESDNAETGNENDASDESGETETVGDASGESGESEIGDNTSGESDGTENESDTSDETDISDETMPADDVQTDIEQVEGSEAAVPRMRTFIDETGMSVTYDTNAEASYIYIVEDGVLKSVTKPGETLSGVVELKQQEGDNAYHTIGENVFQIPDDKENEIEYVILPSGVTTIGENAFVGYSNLRGITLPVTLTTIEDGAFKNCKNMTQLSVPKAVKSIGDSAFEGDASLFMVYIKDSSYSNMTIIGESAFKDCKHLEKFGSDTEFILPGRLESIGASAFENCAAIKKVTLPDSVVEKEIREKNPDTGEEKITIQEALGENVFKNCAGLTDIILSGAKLIPEHAFDGCTGLLSVTFANGNETIDEHAFENCSKLSEIIFSYSLTRVNDYAFSGCSQLRYVEFPNPKVEIGNNGALPNNNSNKLWVRGFVGTPLEDYVKDHNNMRFIAFKSNSTETFQYTYKCLTTSAIGNVKFYQSDKTTAATEKQSFKVGEKIYIFVTSTASAKLVDGSLRCNGTPIGKDSDGDYVFKMPVGGAYITAEFENTKVNQNGDRIPGNITYELSNGSELKVGQTTRMFLIDTSVTVNNNVIPDSEVTFTSSNKKVATVSTHNGTIRAVGTGTAYITATLYDGNGNKVVAREAAIQVKTADVYSLRLKPYTYDTIVMTEEKDSYGYTTGIYLRKKDIENRGSLTFTLLATAYDSNDDNMSVALKWSTSDSKIAKLAKTSTKDTEPQNTITIPSGANGEAAITVKATNSNPIDPNNKTVTTKFIIRVMDSEPRLSTSTITLNPYMEEGVSIEVISAYEAKVDEDNVRLNRNDDKTEPSRYFKLTYDYTTDKDSSIIKFKVNALDTDLDDGPYKECVYIDVNDNQYYLPLNINVKKSIPNPTVKFASNDKINLFYIGEATEVTPIVGNLGNAKIESYRLENLSNSGDDAYFTENFDIDSITGVITRSYKNMHYTSKNKAVTTGYLVLKFAGYKDGVNEKKIKITVPTKTTKPSYKLERTSDTFNTGAGIKTIELSLLDNKTKLPIEMNSDWSVKVDPSTTSSAVYGVSINVYGNFQMDVNPNGSGGKLVFNVYNDNWDGGQFLKFTYTVKITDKKTTFKLSKSSVSLNRFFAGNQTAQVSIKSNQYGIEPTDTTFKAPDPEKLSESKAEQYDKINVDWDAADGFVEVSLTDSDIKNGSYKFTCYPLGDDGNKVTLTVKVTAAAPSLSLKGSATLNLAAGTDTDTAELAIKVKNLPSDCELDADTTASSIEYATNKEDDELAGIADSFNWVIEDNKLKISLGQSVAARTYTFRMTPAFTGYSLGENDKEKQVKFKVKVYRKNISVSLKAKGKLNLLDRYDGIYSAADNAGNSVSKTMRLANTSNPNTVDTIVFGTSDKDTALNIGYDEVLPALEVSEQDSDVGNAQSSDGDEDDNSIPVKYVYNVDDKDSITLTLNVDDSGENAVGESDVITIDPSTNKPKANYVYTATVEKDDYKITSISAYKTNNPENGEVGEDDELIVKVDTIDDGESATLTISTEVDLTDAKGIIIAVEAEKSTSTEEPTKYEVTLSKPDGVEELKYAVVDSDKDLDSVKGSFIDYARPISVKEGQKFAFEVTLGEGYKIDSVTTESELTETTLNPGEENDNVYVYLLEGINADITVSINVKYINGKKITFERNGEHYEIQKNDGVGSEIVESDFSTADGYSFVIVKKEGCYDVKVEVYATEKYEAGILNPITLKTPREENGNEVTYKITAGEITEDITIVVTGIYSVTIDKDNSNVTELKYSVNDDVEYSDYDESNELKLESGDTLFLQFKAGEIASNQKLIVNVDNGVTKSELVASEIDEDIYTYEIEEITGNTTITISIETTQKHTVTLPDPVPAGVELGYTTIAGGGEINAGLEFSGLGDNAKAIEVIEGRDLILKITLKDNKHTVESVSYTVDGEESPSDLTPAKKDGLDYYYRLNVVKDTTISINVTDVCTVTFVKNGTHTKIKKAGESGQVITGNTDSVVKGSDYTFIVEPEDGYKVEVKAYTTESVENADGQYTTVVKDIQCEQDSSNNNMYKIVNKITSDINIVVTEMYTVIINDNTAGTSKISGLSYKTINDEDYRTYNSGNELTIAYDSSLSIKFTPPAGKTIVVLDEKGNRLSADSGNTAEEVVYTISKIKDNKTISIAAAYEILEDIRQETKQDNKITAIITYDENVVSDASGRVILADKDLNFNVAPKNGYKITQVAYKVGSSENEIPLTARTNADYSYNIGKSSITDNITIIVTTEWLDPNNYVFEFNIDGATVKITESGNGVITTTPLVLKIPATTETRKGYFTFSVTPDADKRLRYVGTDSELTAEIIKPDKKSGLYTFKLPEYPDPVTTIYVSATPKKNDIRVNFTGWTSDFGKKATVSMVTFDEKDSKKIYTESLSETELGYAKARYSEDDKVYFTLDLEPEYELNAINAGGVPITYAQHTVTVAGETVARRVTIYTLNLENVGHDVTVELTIVLPYEEEEQPEYKYNLKNCIIYTPVVSNLKDTVVEAEIYDAAKSDPAYGDEQSEYFNIDVADGLIYVTPKEDPDEDNYLKNNTIYQVKIWLKFEKYNSGDEANGDGVWANNKKVIKIKTAQTLPKVITNTKTLNLYQSNTAYTATFVVTLKEGSVGKLEDIEFGEKDEKARESFDIDSEVQNDGSLKVTLSLNDGSRYAANSTNKVNMYVKFKNQAVGTTGTAITMNVKINR